MTNFQPSIYYPVYDDTDGSFELVPFQFDFD